MKTSGLGAAFFIGGYDISGDVGAVQTIAQRSAVLDVTSIDKSAMERLPGLRDGEIAYTAFWNAATGQILDAVKTLPATERHHMYCHGTTVGNPAAVMVGKQTTFAPSRGADGSLVTTVTALASSGEWLEWGLQLTAGQDTHASATNGTSIDNGGATTTGAAAYLQVFSLGSGTVDVDVEDSADDSAFASIISFTGATGRTVERLATAVGGDIRQYVRVATSGTFTNAVIAVTFVRYPDPPA